MYYNKELCVIIGKQASVSLFSESFKTTDSDGPVKNPDSFFSLIPAPFFTGVTGFSTFYEAVEFIITTGDYMLNLYAARWCIHCKKTEEFLKRNEIEYNYIDIEVQADDIVKKVIDVNGGFDWVVPTLEYKGIWRKGKMFNETELTGDLKEMGVSE